MTWLYQNKPFEEVGDNYGFVYIITNIKTNRKYIGKKFFWTAKRKQVNKKRKTYKIESDWKDYWGSSKHLKSDIEKFGKKEFKREILRLCKNRTECSYYETKYIFDNDALLREDFYNHWVSCKITETHVKSMKK